MAACRPSAETRFLNFDPESSAGALGPGWSGFEKTPEGDTFVWCAARGCSLKLEGADAGERLLRFRAWAYVPAGAPPQEVTLTLNGRRLESVALGAGPRVHAVVVPPGVFSAGRNRLELSFAHALAPPGDGRTLAAAFDWLEVVRPPGG